MTTNSVASNAEMGALASVLLKRAMNEDGIVDPSVVVALLLVVEHATGLTEDMTAVNVARLVRETTMSANTFRRALARSESLGLVDRERGVEAGRPRGYVRINSSVMDEVRRKLSGEDHD